MIDLGGQDTLTRGKIIYLIYFIFVVIGLSFYTFNVPAFAPVAMPYWSLGMLALLVWVVSKVITSNRGIDVPNPIIDEPEWSFGQMNFRKILLVISLLVATFVFFSISSIPTFRLVSTPTFQAIEPTLEVGAIFTIMAAEVENFFFFGVVTALIFGLFNHVSRSKIASLIAGILIAALIFTGYHFLVYGTTQIFATEQVFFFGLVMSGWALVFRNLYLPIFVHAANNLAVQVFTTYSVNLGFIFWVVLIFGGGYLGISFIRRRIGR